MDVGFGSPHWFVQTVIGAFVGVVMGVPISLWFARSNSQELRQTADDLKTATREVERLATIALRALEGSGAIDPLARRDGLITGISHPLSVKMDGTSSFQMVAADQALQAQQPSDPSIRDTETKEIDQNK